MKNSFFLALSVELTSDMLLVYFDDDLTFVCYPINSVREIKNEQSTILPLEQQFLMNIQLLKIRFTNIIC